MFPTVDHLTELSTPIADMVIRDHFVSEEPGDFCQSVPENRRPNVTDMHRLRNIRGTEVDDDGFRLSSPFDAKALIQSKIVKTMIDKFLRKPEIDESGTGDFRRWPNVVHRYTLRRSVLRDFWGSASVSCPAPSPHLSGNHHGADLSSLLSAAVHRSQCRSFEGHFASALATIWRRSFFRSCRSSGVQELQEASHCGGGINLETMEQGRNPQIPFCNSCNS